MTMKEKLKAISSDEKSEWVARTKEKLAHAGARKNARAIALRVLDILETKCMTQSELADKMGVSRQQVTKIVKGKENFTFETIDKLEKALQTKLMTIVGTHEKQGSHEKHVSQEEHQLFMGSVNVYHIPASMAAAAFGNRTPMVIGAVEPSTFIGGQRPSSWSASGSAHSMTFILQPIRGLVGQHLIAADRAVSAIGIKKTALEITGIIRPAETSGEVFNMS